MTLETAASAAALAIHQRKLSDQRSAEMLQPSFHHRRGANRARRRKQVVQGETGWQPWSEAALAGLIQHRSVSTDEIGGTVLQRQFGASVADTLRAYQRLCRSRPASNPFGRRIGEPRAQVLCQLEMELQRELGMLREHGGDLRWQSSATQFECRLRFIYTR